jgi:FKBP-type peptidyl-prolyl cis-trans isomerase SlyD
MEGHMNIIDNVYVAFDYKLTLDSGEEIDRSPDNQPAGFITGSGQLIPGLEKSLMGMTVGDKSKISVTPEDAYGQANPDLVEDVPRSHFPGEMELKPGMMFHSSGPNGMVTASIKEIKDADTVVIDLNHPLAGKTLHFDINVVEVRELTAEELSGLSSGCGCGCGSEEESGCGCGSEEETGCGSCGCC